MARPYRIRANQDFLLKAPAGSGGLGTVIYKNPPLSQDTDMAASGRTLPLQCPELGLGEALGPSIEVQRDLP